MWLEAREEFTEDTALELDLLGRALPLTPLASTGLARIRLDRGQVDIGVAAQPLRAHVSVGVADVIGSTPAGCVELLRIRPLLFGTAWKVLDLFMDAVMAANQIPPDRRGRYPIAQKVAHAEGGDLVQDLLPQHTWDALCRVYASTAQLRHSLVHRRVTVDPEGTLIGHDMHGDERPSRLSLAEQEAFARAVMRLGEAAAQVESVDARTQADLEGWLARLTTLHDVPLGPTALPSVIREVTVVVYREGESGLYLLDVPALGREASLSGDGVADLVVEFADQPGVIAAGRLEDAPKELVKLDPAALPMWLRGWGCPSGLRTMLCQLVSGHVVD